MTTGRRSWWRRRTDDPRRDGRGEIHRRRTGPPGEARWWDDQDQHWVESLTIDDGVLGAGWRSFEMRNNEERLNPHGGGPEADADRRIRDARRPSALDEGRAWRRPRGEGLLVARYEVFRTGGEQHREAWQATARPILDRTWRDRWQERGRTPGWIEARWLPEEERPSEILADADPAVDWLRVEDHTGDGREVTVYHHLTLWVDRFLGTLVLRERLGAAADPAPATAALILHEAARRRFDAEA